MIAFPDTLSTTNAIADLIESTNSDALNLSIDNKLSSLGVTNHLDDTTPNTNSVNGLYFKHLASNIAYEKKNETANTVETQSLQSFIEYLVTRIEALEAIVKDSSQSGS